MHGECRPPPSYCNPPSHTHAHTHTHVIACRWQILIWINNVRRELINQDQLIYWPLRQSGGWNRAQNGLISHCVLVCACAWHFIVLCVSGTLSAPSGGVYTKWVWKALALLSIKDGIDWKHESVSAASHPWTADNEPGHQGHGWKQSSSSGS